MANGTVHRHGVLATFAGMMLGVGVMLMVFVYGVVTASIVLLGAALVVGGLVGFLISRVTPARAPKTA